MVEGVRIAGEARLHPFEEGEVFAQRDGDAFVAQPFEERGEHGSPPLPLAPRLGTSDEEDRVGCGGEYKFRSAPRCRHAPEFRTQYCPDSTHAFEMDGSKLAAQIRRF